MATQNAPENPFCIVPAGERCVIKPQAAWSYGNDTTFVFAMSCDANNTFSYLDIHLRPQYTLGEGQAAVIHGRTVKGVVMDDLYYMGDLGPKKMSSFYQISQTGKEVTGIVIFIVIKPKSDVDEILADYKLGRINTGPFTQLN